MVIESREGGKRDHRHIDACLYASYALSAFGVVTPSSSWKGQRVDSQTFDALARSLSAATSRRRVMIGLVAGALGVAGRERADARTCGDVGSVCDGNALCCSGVCGSKDRFGRRRCQCATDKDCRGKNAVCEDGICGVSPFRACPQVESGRTDVDGLNHAGEDLSTCDLSGLDMTEYSFFTTNLSGVNFTNANLTGANFFGANVTGATWNNTTCPSGVNSDANGGNCRGEFILGQMPTGA